MDFKEPRGRALPHLPQRGQRPLPTMPSQESSGDQAAARYKRKRQKKDVDHVAEDQSLELGGVEASRRGSQVGDQVTLGCSAKAPPHRRKRKEKKAATSELEDDQAELVNGDAAEMTTDREEIAKKAKKKKKPKVAESHLPEGLDVEEDDIITDSPPTFPQHSLFSTPEGQSQAVGKVFVERNKRFQAAERSDWRRTSVQMDGMADLQQQQQQQVAPPLWTTRDVSLRAHRAFRVLGLYCHGFLAGFAIWNVVLVYMLAGQQQMAFANLLQQYQGLAAPAQSLLYLLLTLSTVAAFDRVNLAKGFWALRGFLTLDLVVLASFLYFSALVLSLSQQMTSDRINLFLSHNSSLWPPGTEHHVLHPWVTVNLVVALLVGLAWIFMASHSERDYTEGYLVTMEVASPKGEDMSKMTA